MPERDIEQGTPSLEREGVPYLEGPLPEKIATGDPQEGLMPPGDAPNSSVDYGITAREQQVDEPLSERVKREVPEVAPQDVASEDESQTGPLIDPHDDRAAATDAAEEAAAPYVDDLSPEESAVHTRTEP